MLRVLLGFELELGWVVAKAVSNHVLFRLNQRFAPWLIPARLQEVSGRLHVGDRNGGEAPWLRVHAGLAITTGFFFETYPNCPYTGFLNSSLTTLSSRILRRSLARGGRRMYLHKASRPCSSLAASLVAA